MTPLRAKLWNPPNARPDPGINMRNGKPVAVPPGRRSEPVEVPYVVGVPDAVRLENERLELRRRRQQSGPRDDPTIIPSALRWSTQLGGPPNITISERYSNPRQIIFAVAKEWDIQPHIVTSPRKEAFAIRPRFAAIAITYRLSKLSLKEIGKHFGGRDHNTLINACDKMADHIAALDLVFNDQTPPILWVRALKARLEA